MSTGKNSEINKYSATEGRLLPSFLVFLMPLVLAGLLQQSYSLVDGIILGNFIDETALGAVGSVGSLIDVGSLIQIALGGGCAIIVSHLYGAKRYAEVDRLITDIRIIVVGLSLAIALVVILLAPQILKILHTPEDLREGALLYMRICFAGVPFVAMYNVQAGILRGMGDSKHPLGGIAVSSVVNIGLDLLFVVMLHMGIGGAAIATASAEAMSAVYLYLKLDNKRKETHSSSEDEKVADETAIANIAESIKLGFPQLIQSVVHSGGMVLMQNITNILGAIVVIGVVATFKIDSILIAPLLGLGTAVSVFTGQNLGAGHEERARNSLKYGILTSLAFSLVLTVVLWRFGYSLLGLFGLETEATAYGYRYLSLCLPFYWVFGMQFVLHGYLNGAKHTVITSAASIIGLVVRILIAYLLYKSLKGDVLPIAEVASWIICVIIDAGYILIDKVSK
ncbi:MAG: MATE family efflux transporter, partial [Mogibacterium sp.]|nr:MATE family efflux transporter [Mogibacterium sp.]